jgi:hypothetical protein
VKPALVVLAAGLGSRYGSDKQLAGVGPGGEPILHFTALDAARAGFGELILVVRPELESATESLVGAGLRRLLPVRYVHQRAEAPLPGLATPGRSKPWGTAHALAIALDGLRAPCGVVNADDWYGPPALADLAIWLATGSGIGLVAFRLGKTLSPHGTVNRGVVTLAGAAVRTVEEVEGLAGEGSGARAPDGRLFAADTPVSMNLWGLHPSTYARFAARVAAGMRAHLAEPKWECQLPTVVMQGLAAGDWPVTGAMTAGDWCGMTYPADRPAVRERLAAAVADGLYPSMSGATA